MAQAAFGIYRSRSLVTWDLVFSMAYIDEHECDISECITLIGTERSENRLREFARR